MIAAKDQIGGTQRWRLQTISANEARSEMGLIIHDAPSLPGPVAGEVCGPFCAYSTTLTAKYSWQEADLKGARETVAAYRVTVEESCLWEPVHPFLYKGHWQAGDGQPESVQFGWRVLARRQNALTLNGQPLWIEGVTLDQPTEGSLRDVHNVGCNLALIGEGEWTPLADELGPFVLARLPGSEKSAKEAVLQSGPRRPSIAAWIVPPDLTEHVDDIARLDRTTLIAQWSDKQRTPHSNVDLLLVECTLDTLAESTPSENAWVAVVATELSAEEFDPDAWQEVQSQLNERLRPMPGCVGWIARGAV